MSHYWGRNHRPMPGHQAPGREPRKHLTTAEKMARAVSPEAIEQELQLTTNERPMNRARGRAVDDARAPHRPAPTNTASGAGPRSGARELDHKPPPASQASGSGSGGNQQT